MRVPLLTALALATLVAGAGGAGAREYPWCAITSGVDDGGVWNCSYDSEAQCRAWSGEFMCNVNPRHNPQKPGPAPRKKQRQRQQ